MVPPDVGILTCIAPIGLKLCQSTLLYVESISCKYGFVDPLCCRVSVLQIHDFVGDNGNLVTIVLPVVVSPQRCGISTNPLTGFQNYLSPKGIW